MYTLFHIFHGFTLLEIRGLASDWSLQVDEEPWYCQPNASKVILFFYLLGKSYLQINIFWSECFPQQPIFVQSETFNKNIFPHHFFPPGIRRGIFFSILKMEANVLATKFSAAKALVISWSILKPPLHNTNRIKGNVAILLIYLKLL